MAATTTPAHGVLVVEPDARVRTALTALIDATPGLRVVGECTCPAEAEDVRRRTSPTVAVVGMCSCDGALQAFTELTVHLPVVAVSPCRCEADRALAAGAIEFCDQDGDADRLSVTLLAVADAAASDARGRTA
jgi:DNA-binding NarL/FixJ family response regulator